MRKEKDIIEKRIRLNGNRVRVRIPVKTISLEEGVKRAKEVFDKYR